MGEARKRGAAAVHEALTALGVEALGGAVQVRWNQGEAATPFGQMAYFAEFLNLTGLYRGWVESCPLSDTSPNGSKVADGPKGRLSPRCCRTCTCGDSSRGGGAWAINSDGRLTSSTTRTTS